MINKVIEIFNDGFLFSQFPDFNLQAKTGKLRAIYDLIAKKHIGVSFIST